MQDDLMHIGKLLQAEMKRQGVKTGVMATYVGKTPGAVSQWYKTGRISRDVLLLACQKLKIDMAALVAGEVIPEHTPTQGMSYLARDLAKQLDSFKDEEKQRILYAQCTLLISEAATLKEVALQPNESPSTPTQTAPDKSHASRI